jgi:23S rRNA pseudouridine1911/1915/1917 synthase
VLVGKTPGAFENLRRQFQARQIKKIYAALVAGVTESAGSITAELEHHPGDARRMRIAVDAGSSRRKRWRAITRFRRIAENGEFSLLEIEMETGVMHQIRVHVAAIGHAIVADHLYGGDADTLGLERHFLHAHSLTFKHPQNGEMTTVGADLPDELTAVLDRLGMRR